MKIIEKNEAITAYKAFDKDFKCKDFQFEVGKSYQHSDTIKICESGFHSCLNPFDVLSYYDLCESRFAVVKIWGKTETHDEDSKIASEWIEIIKEVKTDALISAHYKYLIASVKDKNNSSQQSQSGDYSQQSQSGDYSKQSQSGDYSKQSQSGDYSQQSQSGNSSKQSQSGNSSQQSQSGDYSKQSQSGDYSQQAQVGNDSQTEVSGNNCVAAIIGANGKIKAVKGTWITLAEYDNNGKCILVKSAQVDGKEIKADVWIGLRNGKFVEVK